MGNVEILAEDARQVAAGKEDRPAAAAADQDGFLAEVRSRRCDNSLGCAVASAAGALPSLCLALMRTEPARRHEILQHSKAIFEFTAPVQLHVAGSSWWFHILSIIDEYRGRSKFSLPPRELLLYATSATYISVRSE